MRGQLLLAWRKVSNRTMNYALGIECHVVRKGSASQQRLPIHDNSGYCTSGTNSPLSHVAIVDSSYKTRAIRSPTRSEGVAKLHCDVEATAATAMSPESFTVVRNRQSQLPPAPRLAARLPLLTQHLQAKRGPLTTRRRI